MNRVISLLPSATEIVFALGMGDALVGISHECDFPPAARSKPSVTTARIDPSMPSAQIDALVREQLDNVGSLYRLNLDLVRELRPNLVLTQQLCTVCAVGFETVRAAMNSLEQPPVVVNLEPRTLDEVFASIGEIASLLGAVDDGRGLVATLSSELRSIPAIEPRPRVLLLEWLAPPFAAGHWIPELVVHAGAVPLLHFEGEHSRQIQWETIATAEFDTLAITCCGFNVERTLHDVAASTELRAVLSVRPDIRIIVFDGNHYFSRPGPRVVESARMLNAALRGVSPDDDGASIDRPYTFANHVLM